MTPATPATASEWTELDTTESYAAPRGAATYLVHYTAEGARGPVTMSGLVTVPVQRRADGAILSWAHGTTGLSTDSAPSRHRPGDSIERYVTPWTEYLQRWVDEGYVVVQPDYEGLGVEEVKATYMHRAALAGAVNTLVDVTRAHLDGTGESEKGAPWLNIGFSQGGYAALAAAHTPAAGLKATIALAPGDTELVNKNLRLMGVRPVDVARMLKGPAVRFFPIVIAGALNAFEGVSGEDFLSERGAQLVAKAEELTLPQLRDEVANTSGGELFTSTANTKKMQALLDEQRLELMRPQGPVLVIAGSADVTINREAIKNVLKVWRADTEAEVDVEYVEIDGATHSDTVAESVDAQREWLEGRGL